MKQWNCAALMDTKKKSRPNTTRKKMRVLDQTTNNDVGNKKEVFCCKSGQNKGTKCVLAGEALENNTLEMNTNQSGKPGSRSCD